MKKIYRLTGANGEIYSDNKPGLLGGNSKAKIYGRLDCPSANNALEKGYARHRVFFRDESIAMAVGYRPCGRCMFKEYSKWKENSE